jgi:subfamily B ATP-binding cassette protein MsbA
MSAPPATSREIYLRLLAHVRPYWPVFTGGVLAMVVLGLTEAGIPAILKPLLDGTFVEQDPFYLSWAPLGIVLLFLVRGLAGIASNAAFATIATRLVFDLRQRMFQRLLSLPTSFYDQHASGTLISKLIYDVTQVTQAGTEVLTTLIKDSVTVVALLAYVFWLDWQLSLFTFLLGPAVAAVALIMGRRIRRLSRRLQGSFGDMTHVLEESTRGHKVVKIYGGQEYEAGRFETIAKRVRHLQFKHKLTSSVSVPVVELIGALVMAAVIYIGTGRAADDQLSVGGFVAFFAALGLLFSPIKRLTKMNDPLQRGLAAAESIFALIDQLPEEDKGRHSAARCRGELRFEGVTVRYPGSHTDALGPVDLVLEPKTTTALVGASGSGKTTLANLVPRIHQPTAGRVLLDGIDLQDWSLHSLREQIAYVSQDVVLFNDSVANNIAYGKPASPEAIRAAAAAAGALEFIEAMPDGFDTPVGENGVRLSGGQRQRLAIARALLADAPLLILDEATSALDTQSEAVFQAALDRLRADRTTLVIAHRLSTVRSADRILVFKEGRIVEEGEHQALLAAAGDYHTLVTKQDIAPSAPQQSAMDDAAS